MGFLIGAVVFVLICAGLVYYAFRQRGWSVGSGQEYDANNTVAREGAARSRNIGPTGTGGMSGFGGPPN